MTSQPRRFRVSLLACVTHAALLVSAGDLIARQVVRRTLAQVFFHADGPAVRVVLAVAAIAAVVEAARLVRADRAAPRAADGGAPSRLVARVTALGLALAFVCGLAAQQRLGARLQSDGFAYYAFLRSLMVDRDVDLTNDYDLLLGADRHAELMTPTSTGYARSAFSIGPAIVWMPFYAAGDVAARYLRWTGVDVKTDGTSFPYRQAVCVAGLFYGLVGLWFCFRLSAQFVSERVAAAAMTTIGLASFMLWYLVMEPTMSHAPSMAGVAAFLWAWTATRERRRPWQWAGVGLLGGLMMDLRWQNALFVGIPAVDYLWQLRRAGGAHARTTLLARGGLFGAGVVVGFLPQLVAWTSMYGNPLAFSASAAPMHWASPHVVQVLWSARNGLFSTSPVTYAAAIGLVGMAISRRGFAAAALVVFCLSVYVNAAVDDWWGGASYGMRRFDGMLPVFTVGLAWLFDWLRTWFARRPAVPVAALGAAFVVWNLTFMQVFLAGTTGPSVVLTFADVSAEQVRTLYGTIGYPFSYPANLLYGLRYGIAPSRYDRLGVPFIGDPSRPYGRVDIGTDDDAYITDGWYAPVKDPDGTTFRWTAETAEALLPLDHAAPLMVQIKLRPFTYPNAPPQQMSVRINDRPFGPFSLSPGWQRVDFPTDSDVWRAGLNRVRLVPATTTVPATVGMSADQNPLGVAVDYIRIQVRQ